KRPEVSYQGAASPRGAADTTAHHPNRRGCGQDARGFREKPGRPPALDPERQRSQEGSKVERQEGGRPGCV
ncbi:hypothetical protein ACM7O6_28915, partial [Pseudomonas aeruginosa]